MGAKPRLIGTTPDFSPPPEVDFRSRPRPTGSVSGNGRTPGPGGAHRAEKGAQIQGAGEREMPQEMERLKELLAGVKAGQGLF